LVVLLGTQRLAVVLDFFPPTSWPIVIARMTGLMSSVAGMVHLLGFDAHSTGLLVRGSVVVKADLGVAAEGLRTPSANAIDSKSRCNKVVSTFIINNYHPFSQIAIYLVRFHPTFLSKLNAHS
jgi:hypothetical protein